MEHPPLFRPGVCDDAVVDAWGIHLGG
jgi:hypothetical protein